MAQNDATVTPKSIIMTQIDVTVATKSITVTT